MINPLLRKACLAWQDAKVHTMAVLNISFSLYFLMSSSIVWNSNGVSNALLAALKEKREKTFFWFLSCLTDWAKWTIGYFYSIVSACSKFFNVFSGYHFQSPCYSSIFKRDSHQKKYKQISLLQDVVSFSQCILHITKAALLYRIF